MKCPICNNTTKDDICTNCGYDLENDYTFHKISFKLSQQEIEKYHKQIKIMQNLYQKALNIPTENIDQKQVQDNGESLCLKALEYETGKNVEKNYAKAITLYQEAIKQGSIKAIYHLAMMHYFGNGTIIDLNKATELLNTAAQNNYADAAYMLGYMNEQAAKKFFLQKKAAPKLDLAIEYYQKAIKLNHPKAMIKLGNIYRDNNNYDKALKLYHQAIELNNFDAAAELGFMYLKGYGVKRDSHEAIELFERAYRNDSAVGTYYLAYMCEFGHSCKMDNTKAKTLRKQAHRQKKFDDIFKDPTTFLDIINKEAGEKQ